MNSIARPDTPSAETAIIPASIGAAGVETKVLTGFIAALALLYLAGGMTYRMGVSVANSAQWVAYTQQARAALADLYAALSDAEAAQRNYLLTGSLGYRAEFGQISTEARARLKALHPLLADQAEQRTRLNLLSTMVSGRVDALSQQMAQFELRGGDAAELPIASDEGLSSLKSIHALIDLMDAAEETLLTARAQELARNRGLTLFALLVTLTIATTALVMLFRSITRDIRERARIAHALDLAQREAQRATRAKSEFLAAMSHEIRTPMNGVIGMIDVLQQSSLAGTQVEMVGLIRESADALLTIIDDILDFSKIEAGKLELEQAPMSIAAVVEKTCSLLNRLAERRGGTLRVFVDPSIPASALGDAARLRQVLINLIGNAIKFSSGLDRTGRVSVRAVAVEKGHGQLWIEFRIIDNGIGMDAPTIAKVFTSFMQADPSTTRKYGGTGLGLAIAKQLSRLMGGDINVESIAGQGSTFTVRVPFAELPAAADSAGTASPIENLNCLVVGGPAGIADDLARYLSSDNAIVARVPDLSAARDWTRRLAPQMAVWVVDAGEDLASVELEGLIRTRADPGLRAVLVIVGRSPLRNPCADTEGLLLIDGNALTREGLAKAVAIAAGRVEKEPTAAAGNPVMRRSIAPTREQALASHRLILVAEDNEINQKVIRQQLELLGYAADVSPNGQDALNRIKSREYALLLTDLHMPGMDGYDLALAVRLAENGRSRMPIVALTANTLKGEAERCRAVGMDDYLGKPVALTQLAALLARWLPLESDAAREQPTGAPVDVAVLEALVGRDPEIVREVLLEFRDSAALMGRELIGHYSHSNAVAVGTVAHKLKASARSVGALRLGELCAVIESASLSADLATCALLVPQFEGELLAVIAYLDRILRPAPEATQQCA